jgi:hypothetical protein
MTSLIRRLKAKLTGSARPVPLAHVECASNVEQAKVVVTNTTPLISLIAETGNLSIRKRCE